MAALLPQIMTQMRVGMAGPVGLDLPACLMLTDVAGVGRDVAAVLLAGVEAGVLRAARRATERATGGADGKPDL